MERSSRQSPCNAVAVARLDSFSPEAMDDAVDSGHLDHVQLTPGRFQAHLVRSQIESTCFDWGSYNLPLYARGTMPQDRVTLGLVLSPHQDGILNGCGLERPALAVYTEGAELDYRLAAETSWSGLQLSRDTLEDVGVHCPCVHSGIVDSDRAGADRLTRAVAWAVDSFTETANSGTHDDASSTFMQSVFQGLLAAYASALPAIDHYTATGVPTGHRQLVSKVQEYLDDTLAEPVRIRTLCAVAGVSFKTLQRAFVGVLGMAPQRYLALARLSRARRLLLAACREETRVAEVAYACGCFHLSRFSRDYRLLFGESPSQTLAQNTGMPIGRRWRNS